MQAFSILSVLKSVSFLGSACVHVLVLALDSELYTFKLSYYLYLL
jgi:hypothetical protein